MSEQEKGTEPNDAPQEESQESSSTPEQPQEVADSHAEEAPEVDETPPAEADDEAAHSEDGDDPSEEPAAPPVDADEGKEEDAETLSEASPSDGDDVPVWEIADDILPPELADEVAEDGPETADAAKSESAPASDAPESREDKLKRLQRKNRKKNEDSVPRAVVDAVKNRVKELSKELAEKDAQLQALEQTVTENEEAVEKVGQERDEIQNRLLRTAADLENFRRRAEREKKELKRYGIDKVVLELIPAVDNMERALEHAKEKQGDSENSFIDGVEMVYKQILTALKKHGVTGFDAVGQRFDPERHEAIQQVETSEHETGEVVEEFQKGYFLHDRLLRPAMVSVAKRIEAPQDEEHSPEEETPADDGGDDVESVDDPPPSSGSPAAEDGAPEQGLDSGAETEVNDPDEEPPLS